MMITWVTRPRQACLYGRKGKGQGLRVGKGAACLQAHQAPPWLGPYQRSQLGSGGAGSEQQPLSGLIHLWSCWDLDLPPGPVQMPNQKYQKESETGLLLGPAATSFDAHQMCVLHARCHLFDLNRLKPKCRQGCSALQDAGN